MIEFAIPETVTLPLSFSNRLPLYIKGDDVLSRHLNVLDILDRCALQASGTYCH